MPRVKDFPTIPRHTRTSAEMRAAWGHTPPSRADLYLQHYTFWDGTTIPGGINPIINAAVTALDEVFERHRYRLDRYAAGDDWCYANRTISGSGLMSLHALAIALDINATTNPRSRRFKTDMTPAMIDDLQTNVTHICEDGIQRPVWQWGGTWGRNHRYKYDPMHFQIALTPDECLAYAVPQDPEHGTVTETFIDGDLTGRVGNLEEQVAQLQRRSALMEAVVTGLDRDVLARSIFRGVVRHEPGDEDVVEISARLGQGVALEEIFDQLKARKLPHGKVLQ